MKKNIVNIINYFCDFKYQIGFFDFNETILQKNSYPTISWLDIRDYKEGWFADPFILEYEDEFITLLVEEYVYAQKKGRISLLKIKKEKQKYRLSEVQPILEESTHFSFPYIVKDNGNIYICPENYQSGCVKLYSYNIVSRKLESPVIIIDEPLVDVQIIKYNGWYYAMGVLRKTGEMYETKNLLIYRSKTILGKFDYFQKISNNLCEERGAGQIFNYGLNFIRPAQCCEGGYGICTIFYELFFDNDGFITEKEISRLFPKKYSQYGLSLHTFNKTFYNCVVDGHDYKNLYFLSRYIAPILELFWKIYKKLI